MAVPKYDWWYLPLLKLLSYGQTRRISDVYVTLAKQADLSDADMAEMLPSGTDHTYRNRIGWARTFLKKAGLVESPKWGHVRISERGKVALKQNPARIDDKWLAQYPEFVEWMKPSKQNSGTSAAPSGDATPDATKETPREMLERVYSQMQRNLADELLERIKQVSPAYFEKVVVDVMLAMGYGGIDGIIDEDRLGLDKICLQANAGRVGLGVPLCRHFREHSMASVR